MFLKTVTILIVGFSSALGQTKSTEQAEDGSVSFQYFDSDAKAAADKLEALFVTSATNLAKYVTEVNTSNRALTALDTYVKAEASAKGTNCYIGGQDEDCFKDSAKDIETALVTCTVFRPQDDREGLKKAIVEGLKKIQTYDNNLKLNAQVCFSLRVPKSQGCIDAENKAKDGIKAVVSAEEISKYQALSDKSFTSGKAFIDSCFLASTKQLQDQLTGWTKRITDCQASLNG